MPGLDPGICPKSAQPDGIRTDDRVEPGHDGESFVGVCAL